MDMRRQPRFVWASEYAAVARRVHGNVALLTPCNIMELRRENVGVALFLIVDLRI